MLDLFEEKEATAPMITMVTELDADREMGYRVFVVRGQEAFYLWEFERAIKQPLRSKDVIVYEHHYEQRYIALVLVKV